MSRNLMQEKDLAERVRTERKDRGLTQQDVADRMGKTIQAVSKAENYTPGDGMTSFRIRIIEELTGSEVNGPLYEIE
jgi:transcriptional regulator with XRE-family HTH domain